MGWYEAIKDAIGVAQKADNIDLTRQLLDVQKEMMDIQQENFELKKHVQELNEIIDKTSHVEYNDVRNAVYEVLEDGKENGPYCTHCWEADKKLISLLKSGATRYKCPHCKTEVKLYEPSEADLLK